MLRPIKKVGDGLLKKLPKYRCFLKSLFFYYYLMRAPNAPSNLYVESTTHCNYNCIMCGRCGGFRREYGFMDFELYKRVIDEAAEIGVHKIVPHIWGEPLLHPKFVEMVQYAKDKGLYVEFTTTGFLLTEKNIRDILNTKVDSIVISFHGMTKEDYMKAHGIDGFERVIENVKKLCRIKKEERLTSPIVEVHPIIMDNNFKNMHKVFSIFGGIVDGIRILSCGYHPEDNKNDCRLVKFDTIRKNPCLGLFTDMVVSWDGKISTCCRDSNLNIIVGDMKDGLLKSFNSSRMKHYRKLHALGKYGKMPMCKKCLDYEVFENSIPSELRRKIISGAIDRV